MVRALTALTAFLLLASPARRPATGRAVGRRPGDGARSPRRLAALAGRRRDRGRGRLGRPRSTTPTSRSNLWINPAERPGNKRDDDGNGYVDDVHGVNLSRPRRLDGSARRRRPRHARGGHDRRRRQRPRRDRRRVPGEADDGQGLGERGRARRRDGRGHPLRGRQRRADHQHQPRDADRRPARARRDRGRRGRGRPDRLLGRQHRAPTSTGARCTRSRSRRPTWSASRATAPATTAWR